MPPLEACTQPECALQTGSEDRLSLAETIVRVLTGDTASPIQRKQRCLGCVQRVLDGGEPFPTAARVEELMRAGEWTRRRARRRRMREAH